MVPRKGRTDLHGDHFFPFLLPLPNIRTQAVRPGDQRRLRCELLGGIGPTNACAALAVGCAGLDLNSGVEYPADADNPYAYRKNPAAIMDVFQQIGEHHA